MTSGYRMDSKTLSSQGLWVMRAEPGPGFRWGALKRRSALNADGTEGSTARQEDAIYAHVERNQLGRIVAVFSDIASAFDPKAKRPEYDNALLDLQAGRIDGIIVWKLDRLTRRRNQMRRILTLLEECSGRLVSVVEGIDTADPNKREITELVLNVYIGAAQAESEAIAERVRLMQHDRARKGLVQRGGERPYGHAGKEWNELVSAEVEILHEAGRRVLEGEAAYAIARDFTAREVKTTRGTTFWSSEVLLKILRSPRMVGMHDYDGVLYPYANVPPIFEREEWERICAKLEHKPAAPTETRLLSNVAQCGICTNHLRASGWNGVRSRGHDDFTYRCRQKTKDRDDGACGRLSIIGPYADEEVSRRTIAFLSDRENVERILLTYADKANLAKTQARVAELTESRAALFDARFTPPSGMPKLPEDVYYQKLKAIEDERKALMRSSVVTRDAAMLEELLETKNVEATWNARPVTWRRAILKLVVAAIVIEPRGKGCEPGTRPHERRFDGSRIRMQFLTDVIE
jgi:DNA invertase Pin-like site-specific DNA recombinase